MFPHRIAMLFSPQDVDTAATTVVDLDLLDPVSRLFIKFKATNGDSVNADVPMANVTKVEIVDGSDVLWTLTGKAVDAVGFYDRGKPELHSFSYVSAYGNESMLVLNFGRFPFDPMYALEPTRFRNLQLKITHDEDVCNAATTVNELTVWAEIFSGRTISPVGFFQVKEQYAYTPTVNGYEELELPTDFPIRTLYVDALIDNGYLGSELLEVRLDEDNLKNIFYDGNYSELMRIWRPYFGKYEHKIFCYLGDTLTEVNTAPTQELCIVGSGLHTDHQYMSIEHQFGAVNAGIADVAGNFHLYCSGYMPHGIGAIPFGDRQNPEDWYDPRNIGKLRLRLQGGAGATGTYRVLIQQVRPY